VIFMTLANCDVELIEPIGSEHAASEWLAAHGPGLQHLAIEVSDIEQEAARLSAAGYKSRDAKPRPGARGGEMLFLDPSAICGLLVQLVQPAR
jgi:methylmalonyl-CoA epimerase